MERIELGNIIRAEHCIEEMSIQQPKLLTTYSANDISSCESLDQVD